MECPVCPRSAIPEEVNVCPGCGADLLPIRKAQEMAKIRYNEAIKLEEIGALDSACLRLAAAVVEDENFVQARVLLGKLLWRMGHTDAAITKWEEANSIDPDNENIADLLNNARRSNRRRSRDKSALWAALLLLVVAALIVPWALTERSVKSETAALRDRLDGMDMDRTEHSRLESELAGVRYELDTSRQNMERLKQEYDEYILGHSRSNEEYDHLAQANAELNEALKTARNESSVALAQLESERYRRAEIRTLLDETRERLDQVSHEYAHYVGGYSHSNEDYKNLAQTNAALREELTISGKELSSARAELEAEKDRREDLQQRMSALQGQVNEMIRNHEDMIGAIAKVSSSADDANGVINEMREDLCEAEARLFDFETRMQRSLIVLYGSLRPEDADELAVQINELRDRRERLEEQVHRYEEAAFAPVRLLYYQNRLTRCEDELAQIEADYEARVLPWIEGMRILRQNGNQRSGDNPQ